VLADLYTLRISLVADARRNAMEAVDI